MLLLSIEDVTERKEIAEMRFQRLFETAKDGIMVVDLETKTVQDVNPFFLELTGYARQDFAGKVIRRSCQAAWRDGTCQRRRNFRPFGAGAS